MTPKQGEAIVRLAGHWGLKKMEIIINPGFLYGLPDGWVVVNSVFDRTTVTYGISTLGEVSS